MESDWLIKDRLRNLIGQRLKFGANGASNNGISNEKNFHTSITEKTDLNSFSWVPPLEDMCVFLESSFNVHVDRILRRHARDLIIRGEYLGENTMHIHHVKSWRGKYVNEPTLVIRSLNYKSICYGKLNVKQGDFFVAKVESMDISSGKLIAVVYLGQEFASASSFWNEDYSSNSQSIMGFHLDPDQSTFTNKNSSLSTCTLPKPYNVQLYKDHSFSNPHAIKQMCTAYDIQCNLSLLLDMDEIAKNEKLSYENIRKEQMISWSKDKLCQGIALARKNRFSDAITCYNESLSFDPKQVDAYVARGAAYANQLKYTEALRDFQVSLELDPSHENAKRYFEVTKSKIKTTEVTKTVTNSFIESNESKKLEGNYDNILDKNRRTLEENRIKILLEGEEKKRKHKKKEKKKRDRKGKKDKKSKHDKKRHRKDKKKKSAHSSTADDTQDNTGSDDSASTCSSTLTDRHPILERKFHSIFR